MKKQEGEDEKNPTFPKLNQFDFVLSSKSFFPSLEFIFLIIKPDYFTYNSVVFFNHFSSVFRPPSSCNII